MAKTLMTIILSFSSPSSSTSYFNIPKTLKKDPSHKFNAASSQFLQVNITDVSSTKPLTVFVPEDQAFADSSGYKTLLIDNKFLVLMCHMVSDYLSPSLLLQAAKVGHVQSTMATESMGNGKFLINITAIGNGSVAVGNPLVRGLVTRTIYDHSPIAVYGITKVLLPLARDIPDLPSPPPKTTDDASVAAVCGYDPSTGIHGMNFFVVLELPGYCPLAACKVHNRIQHHVIG